MFVCGECGAMQPVPGHCGVDGSQVAPIGDDVVLGSVIGPYRVARLLGVGGMGRVYKGVHPAIGSRVAIKVLSRECSDRRELVERFFSEAKAVNVIRHESIVNVLDLATLPDGRPYIIMEYLDGAPLSGILDDARRGGQRLPLGGVARLAVEVLDALAAAHAKGIVHRDLKPDNIYITPQGRAKVLDFGIAKLQPELGGSATHTGSLLGTPHYMSPEQAAGRSVDARADLYAIGVILFECATLQRPFAADALFDLLRKHIEEPPPSPRMLRPDMPPALEAVILASLAKSPDQRYANAQAMSVALQQATAPLPPDQWAPIQPHGRPSSPQAWASTAPASWASGDRRPPGSEPSTQTAGQVASVAVVTAKAAPSNKGVWIAVGAVALVGGGIAAAALAGGGDAKPAAGEVVSAAEPAPPIGAPPAIPDPDDDRAPESASAPRGSGSPASRGSGSTPDPAPTTRGGVAAPDSPSRPRVSAAVAAVEAQSPAATATTSIVPVRPTTSTPVVKNADGWIRSTELPTPGSLKRLDVQKLVPWAIAEAKKVFPDAVLFRIDAENVSPSGIADVSGADHSLDFRFIVPSRVQAGKDCAFRIDIEADGAEMLPMFGNCKEAAIGAPRCSFTQIWEKARAAKAPAQAGEIGYRGWKGGRRWYVDVKDSTGAKLFSEMYDDSCGKS